MKKLIYSSPLIALEGIDGAGKSTLAQGLYTYYTKKKYPVLLTKEPGGSALGKILRPLLQEKNIARCPKAEFLLFAADRAQHFNEIVVPALQKGMMVISDRMADSSLVYQGFGRGLNIEQLQTINQWVMGGLQPTITIYLQLSLEIALKRLKKRNSETTIFEEDVQLLEDTIQGFNTLYKDRPDVIIINAQASPEKIVEQVITKIDLEQNLSLSCPTQEIIS